VPDQVPETSAALATSASADMKIMPKRKMHATAADFRVPMAAISTSTVY